MGRISVLYSMIRVWSERKISNDLSMNASKELALPVMWMICSCGLSGGIITAPRYISYSVNSFKDGFVQDIIIQGSIRTMFVGYHNTLDGWWAWCIKFHGIHPAPVTDVVERILEIVVAGRWSNSFKDLNFISKLEEIWTYLLNAKLSSLLKV